MSQTPHVAVVLPAYNERARIQGVLDALAQLPYTVVVADDGSKDGDLRSLLAGQPNVHVIRHRVNLGKGAALRLGCDAAIQLGADILVVMDSDGQHEPADVPNFVAPLANGSADIVYGARTIGKEMPMASFLGNKIFTILINLLYHVAVNDTQGGFRSFTKDAYAKIRWTTDNYAMETEMIARAAKHHLRATETQIKTIYHDKYKGTTPLDGISILWTIIKWKIYG